MIYQMNSLNVPEYADYQEVGKLGRWSTVLYLHYQKDSIV